MRKVLPALISCVVVLTGIGVIFVDSSSSVRAATTYGDPHYFLKRQLIWLAVSLVLAVCAARFDYHLWQKRPILKWLLMGFAAAGLIAVFLPGLGHGSHGGQRWVGFGGVRFQPGEIAKLATVILMSVWMSGIGWRVKTLWKGFALPMLVLGVALALLMKEPDFGATFVTAIAGVAILFVAGARWLYVLGSAVVGGGGFLLLILHDHVRCERVMVWVVKIFGKTAAVTEWLAWYLGKSVDEILLDVAGSAKKDHAEQSRLAFINGGEFGVGLNNSMQKHYYLPEAHTDFIYAIAGEEWGLPGTLGILLAFAGVLICGLLIALRAPDRLGRLMAFGLTLLLVFQAAFNMGVVTGCLPVKGLALPFISYGGSNLVTAFVAIGILINIGKHIDKPDDHVRTRLYEGAWRET